jgi:hypothetical protein
MLSDWKQQLRKMAQNVASNLTPLEATLMILPASVANKRLTV